MKEKTYIALLIGALICVLITSLFIKSSIDLQFSENFTVIDLPIFGMIGAGLCVCLAVTYKLLYKREILLRNGLIKWHIFLTLFGLLFIIIVCMRPPIIFDDVKGIFDKVRWGFLFGAGVILFAQGLLVWNILRKS